jgi:anaerobic ribonucleoside-triphosphate reductase activating protein
MPTMSTLRVAAIVDDTEAEGPGRRWAIWLQGCSIRCPGCCNPEMFDERRGREHAVDDLVAQIAASPAEGITLLGGEPFEQAASAAALATAAKQLGKTVMVFSGYTLAELEQRPDAAPLLAATDLLVDGRFDRDRPEPPPPLGRRWIGSTNQTMHYLTQAYAPSDPRMRGDNTIEIRWTAAGLTINGWPIASNLLGASEKHDRRR